MKRYLALVTTQEGIGLRFVGVFLNAGDAIEHGDNTFSPHDIIWYLSEDDFKELVKDFKAIIRTT